MDSTRGMWRLVKPRNLTELLVSEGIARRGCKTAHPWTFHIHRFPMQHPALRHYEGDFHSKITSRFGDVFHLTVCFSWKGLELNHAL